MNKIPVSYIDAYMGDTRGVCILEEYQVAGLQVIFCNIDTMLILGFSGAVEGNAVLLEYILHKPGAIKSAGGASAPHIGHTDVFF